MAKWSKLRRQRFAEKKQMKLKRSAEKLEPVDLANTQAMTSAVDIGRMREYEYRRGLIDAIASIIRELR